MPSKTKIPDKENIAVKKEAALEEKSLDTSEEKEINEVTVEDRNRVFNVGDTVKVSYKIVEGGKERIQPYEGIVILKKGEGISKTFTVRRLGAGQIGVERIFPVYSPKISSLEVIKRGKVRRAKLYYLRKRVGKQATKIKEIK